MRGEGLRKSAHDVLLSRMPRVMRKRDMIWTGISFELLDLSGWARTGRRMAFRPRHCAGWRAWAFFVSFLAYGKSRPGGCFTRGVA